MARNFLILAASALLLGCVSQVPIAIIPVEIVNGNPVTSARIGDVQIDVVVDTGGLGGIAISSDDLQRLNVNFTGDLVERTDAAGDTFESRAFVVPELFLGGTRFTTVQGFERVGSTNGFAGGAPINVLGRSLLHNYTVIVDYPNGQILLYSGEQGRSICGPATSELAENEDGQSALPIQADGGQMLALLDTGATYSFVQSKVIASRNLQVVDDLYKTDTLRIGDKELGPLDMVVLPIDGAPQIDVILGANFFSQQSVCFDFSRRTVAFLN